MVVCCVTFTMVAFLWTMTCLEFVFIDSQESGRLDDLQTFLDEIVIEENPALFSGIKVFVAEVVSTCDALTGCTEEVRCRGALRAGISSDWLGKVVL